MINVYIWPIGFKFTDPRIMNTSSQKLAVLEEFYSHLFEIMLKTYDPIHLKPVVRLPSFLHNGATNEIPIAQENTIFLLPSIEGKFVK